MEYIVFWAAMLFLILIIFIKGLWDKHKSRKTFIRKLYEDYGKLPDREYHIERFQRINRYYLKHPKEGQLDDITWNDLNMDEIFKRMNYTLSSTGEEYLYYTLRSPQLHSENLLHQEEMAEYFHDHADERVKVQMLLNQLGTCDKYSLYDYLEYLDMLGERSNRKQWILHLLFLLMIVICFYQLSFGLAALAILIIYNIINYYKEKKLISPYIISFAYVMRLLEVSRSLTKLKIPPCKNEWQKMRYHQRKLSGMTKGSAWAMSATAANTGGNPLEIIMDYVNIMFHIDIMIFNKMLSELKGHLEDVDILVSCIGAVETAVCIAAYRASIKEGWCKPLFLAESDLQLVLKDAYHPLIEDPVKNSIAATNGVLLTGSNASGKSTFLKTVAVNAILAQTIQTCMAKGYEGPFFQIYSSMSLRDSMESGDSYYIAEIKSIKRILDASDSKKPVLCFIDEVLRGTNTVERIAASTQILLYLAEMNSLCFAATHDVELTDLLDPHYDNYHFEEEIADGDIFFPYRLLEGKTTTKNAIKLLEIMGYDKGLIDRSLQQAERFLNSGIWTN